MSFVENSTVSVTNVATLIVSAHSSRRAVLISNNSSSPTLFIGTSSGVTAANGTPVPGNQAFSDDIPWKGTWYGIVSSGSCDVRVLEAFDEKIGGVAQ